MDFLMRILVGLFALSLAAGCSSLDMRDLHSENPANRALASDGLATPEISLAEPLRGYVKTLGQGIYTYHYVTREQVGVAPTGVLDLTDPKLTSHLQGWASYFSNLSQPKGTGMVRGLYLATDPVASRAFGKDHWLLYRVALQAATKYLDLKSLVGQDGIPSDWVAKLNAGGCDLAKVDNNRWTDLFYKSFDPACRRIALQTLTDLGVELIDYDWISTGFTSCPTRPTDAFILLTTKDLPADAVRIFYAELPHSGQDLEEQLATEGAFLQVVSTPSGSEPQLNPKNYEPWSALDAKAAKDHAFDPFAHQNFFGCQ
jgi:hypothetical protein